MYTFKKLVVIAQFLNLREKNAHKIGFDIMPRGRKRVKNPPLSNAERQRNYCAKQNKTNPECYKLKVKKANKKHYEK